MKKRLRSLSWSLMFFMIVSVSGCEMSEVDNMMPIGTLTPTATSTPVPMATSTPVPTPTSTPVPTATSTPVPTATSTPVPTATSTPVPTATSTQVPTATSTQVPTATSTQVPTATSTSVPTATSTPVPTATSTPVPTATSTPVPTATSTPAPTATNTPVPTATSTPTPIPTLPPKFPNIIDKTNTKMNATCFNSEEEATRYFFEMALDGYYQFGILAKDLSMLHTKEEYIKLFPVICELEIESVTKYNNGYYLQFNNVRLCEIDAEELYTIYTGDASFLNKEEKKAYQKLLDITEQLDLDGKSDIDKMVAIHDYLLLNTAYDMNAVSNPNAAARYVEGTLNNNLAVCSGYASTFRLFLALQGIPCEYVWSEEGNHGWNLVQLDGEWYHVDVTWDDPVPDEKGRILYTHFMMTDKEVAQLDNHEDWECECGDASSHNCNDTTYRLYPYKDFVCDTEEEAIAVIEAQANDDTTNKITIVYPSDSSLTQDSLLDLVMETLNRGISYMPSVSLGSSHMLLIVNK